MSWTAMCSSRASGSRQKEAERGPACQARRRERKETTVPEIHCFSVSVLSETILRWRVLYHSCRNPIPRSLRK